MARASPPARPLEGIILHMGAYGESHRLVELFCATEGRITLLARGARASRRRFAGVLDVFVQIRAHVTGGHGGALGTLAAADLLDARLGIRRDLERLGRAHALCGCVRMLWPPGQPEPRAYTLLELALNDLAAGQVVRAAGAYPRLARAAGMIPNLRRCSRCRGDCTPKLALGDGAQPLCHACAASTARILSPSLVAALAGEKVDDPMVADEVENIVLTWVGVHCGRPLKKLVRPLDVPTAS